MNINYEIVKLLEKQRKLEKERDKINELISGGRDSIVMIIFFIMSVAGIFTMKSFLGKISCLGIALLIAIIFFFLYKISKKKKTDWSY